MSNSLVPSEASHSIERRRFLVLKDTMKPFRRPTTPPAAEGVPAVLTFVRGDPHTAQWSALTEKNSFVLLNFIFTGPSSLALCASEVDRATGGASGREPALHHPRPLAGGSRRVQYGGAMVRQPEVGNAIFVFVDAGFGLHLVGADSAHTSPIRPRWVLVYRFDVRRFHGLLGDVRCCVPRSGLWYCCAGCLFLVPWLACTASEHLVSILLSWFLSPSRWRSPGGKVDAHGSSNGDKQRQQGGGRLGDACCRLLGALVLTTAMHPGTLMADLGAGPLQDGPTVRLRLLSF